MRELIDSLRRICRQTCIGRVCNSVSFDSWDESKHPRGNTKNKGQFAKKGISTSGRGNGSSKDNGSRNAGNGVSEGLLYNGKFIPITDMPIGSVERQAFDLLKFSNSNRREVIRSLNDEIESAEDWGWTDQVRMLTDIKDMIRSGASVSSGTKQVEIEKSLPLGDEVTPSEWDEAKRTFGTTDSPMATGFITPDGECLDFSSGGGVRGQDHRAIGSAIHRQKRSGTDHPALVDAVLSGGIRYMPEANGFHIGKKPTEAQWDKIWDFADSTGRDGKKITIDLVRNGDFAKTISVEYGPKTSVSRIRDDVMRYFDSGETPRGTSY